MAPQICGIDHNHAKDCDPSEDIQRPSALGGIKTCGHKQTEIIHWALE